MSILPLSACKNQSLSDKAYNELMHTLNTQQEFIKVHAAEYLIWLGHPEPVRKVFLEENRLHGNEPKYRIGIWRVMAQTESDAAGRQQWYEKIYNAFGNLDGPDRLHAAETLAKLKLSPLEKYPQATQKSVNDESRNMQVYTHWALSYAPGADVAQYRNDFLNMAKEDSNHIIRMISAYVVRRTKGLTAEEWSTLATAALDEPDTSSLKKNMLNTAFVTFPDGMKENAAHETISKKIINGYQDFSAQERIELSQALAESGNDTHIEILRSYLEDENSEGVYAKDSKEAADVRAAAAYAILKINGRIHK